MAEVVQVSDKMLIPVRCWSCGKVIAHIYEQYKQAISDGGDPQKTFDDIGLERYCCRRMLVGHVDLIDDIAPFSIARDQ